MNSLKNMSVALTEEIERLDLEKYFRVEECSKGIEVVDIEGNSENAFLSAKQAAAFLENLQAIEEGEDSYEDLWRAYHEACKVS